MIFGGEALDLPGLRPWFERHGDERPRLVNMYGITETTVHVTYRAAAAGRRCGGSAQPSIGVPIPDLRVARAGPHGAAGAGRRAGRAVRRRRGRGARATWTGRS